VKLRPHKIWLAILIIVIFVSACSGGASSRQADVDRAVKATLTAAAQVVPTATPTVAATSTPESTPTSTPEPTFTPTSEPTATYTPLALDSIDLSKALLRPGDVTLGGDYPATRWVTCTGYKPTSLPISDSMKATIGKTATGGIAVANCGGLPGIAQEFLLVGSERQAERLFSEASEMIAGFAQFTLGATSSTVRTDFGDMFVAQVPTKDGLITILILQVGPLTINMDVYSSQTLIAADYLEVADAAVARIGLAQLGK
jgi:hypothetical protein